MNFFDKLTQAIAYNQSLLVVGLDPNPESMPSNYDNLGDWLQFQINETKDLVCAYKPTLGFYQALGATGIELLQTTLSAIPSNIPVILDAKHSDLNTSSLFARTIFEQWQVDAVTLSPYAGQDQVAPFLVYPGKAVFILCCTSNQGAIALQQYPTPESPFYLQVVEVAKTWGTPEAVALEVGTTNADILARIRATAPERVILVRSIWAEGGSDLNQILNAGLNANGEGLLIPVPLEMLTSLQPAVAIQPLKEAINQVRNQVVVNSSTCELWMPDVCLLNQHPQQDLILQLYDLGCILFGSFVQASGATFPYYIDLVKSSLTRKYFIKLLVLMLRF